MGAWRSYDIASMDATPEPVGGAAVCQLGPQGRVAVSHALRDQAFRDMRYPAKLWAAAAMAGAILGLSAGAGLWLLFDPGVQGLGHGLGRPAAASQQP